MTQEQIDIRKKQGSKKEKRLLVKAKDIKRLTIWDDRVKMQNARRNGYLHLIVDSDGGQWYNIKKIDPIFLKAKA